MSFVVSHLPHLLPMLAAFAIVTWLWASDPPVPKASEEPTAAPLSEDQKPVRRETARRGMLALGPLLAALGTGAVIYGIDLGAGEPGRGLAWTHTGFSMLLVLLAAYKLADAFRAASAADRRPGRALQLTASLSIAALLLPLLITGIVLLAAPSAESWAAYGHLVAAAWWTGVVLWHLRRYLAPSIRTVRPFATADRHLAPAAREPKASATIARRPTGSRRHPNPGRGPSDWR